MFKTKKRVSTPTVIQMEALECGAASLSIILGYYKKFIPLEELRIDCGVSRSGSNAANILKAAAKYGMLTEFAYCELEDLSKADFPMIIHWQFKHFLVLEGITDKKAYLNDPATGPRAVSIDEIDKNFTGHVIKMKPGPFFKPSGTSKNIKEIWLQYLKGSKEIISFILSIGFFLLFASMVIPVCSKIFVDEILIGGKHSWLPYLLALLIIIALSQAINTWLRDYFLLRWEIKLLTINTNKTLQHLLKLPIAFFQQRFAGDLVSRINLNSQIAGTLSQSLSIVFLNAFIALFFLVIMFQYNLLLTLIALIFACINIIFFKTMLRWRIDRSTRILQENSLYTSFLMSGLRIIETIKSSGSENSFFIRLAGQLTNVLNVSKGSEISMQALQAIPTILSSISNMSILVVGGLQIMQGNMSMGSFVAFQSLMQSFLAPIGTLISTAASCQELTGNVTRVNDVLRYPEENFFASKANQEKVTADFDLTGNIKFLNISFGYSKSEEAIIQDLSFHIAPGQSLALVGSSGSGKSTVSRLIAGLYLPWQGEILLDNYKRQDLPKELLAFSLGMVSQEITMFSGTIKDNITLFNDEIPFQDILVATKDACIHDEILKDFGGYDSTLLEGGKNISGGQRQRLEIARVLCRNPKIVILDEATSALDPIDEKNIMDNIKKRGCSLLIIAHRLSAVRDCNQIIMLEKGKIIEQGTHNELMLIEQGKYKSLVAIEA